MAEETLGQLWINIGVKSTVADDLANVSSQLEGFQSVADDLSSNISAGFGSIGQGLRDLSPEISALGSDFAAAASDVDGSFSRMINGATGFSGAISAASIDSENDLRGIETTVSEVGSSFSQLGLEGASGIGLFSSGISEANSNIEDLGSTADDTLSKMGEGVLGVGAGLGFIGQGAGEEGEKEGTSGTGYGSSTEFSHEQMSGFAEDAETVAGSFGLANDVTGDWYSSLDDARLGRNSNEMKILGDEIDNTAKKGAKLSDLRHAGPDLTIGLTVPLVAGGVAAKDLMGKYDDFQSQMALVSTEVPNASQDMMDQLGQQALQFSSQYGIPLKDTTAAMLQDLKEGFSTSDLSNQMSIEAQMAIGSGTSFSDETAGMKSAMEELSNTRSTTGKEFQQITGETFQQYISSIDPATGKTRTLQDALNELNKVLGVTQYSTKDLTDYQKQFDDQNSSVSKKLAEVTGMNFDQFKAARGETGQDAVKDALKTIGVEGTTYNTTSDFFSNQKSKSFVTGYTEPSQTRQQNFEKNDDTDTRKSAEATQELDNALVGLGKALAPLEKSTIVPMIKDLAGAITAATPFLTGLVNVFDWLPQPVREFALGGLAVIAAIGPVAMVVGHAAAGIVELGHIIGPVITPIIEFGTAIAEAVGVGGALAIAGSVIIAFIGIFYGIPAAFNLGRQAGQQVRNFFDSELRPSIGNIYKTFLTWNGISGLMTNVKNYITSSLGNAEKYVTGQNWGGIGSGLINTLLAGILNLIVPQPLGMIVTSLGGVTSYLTGINWSSVGSGLINTLISGISNAIPGLYSTVSGMMSTVSNYFPHSPAKVGPFSVLPDWSAIFTGINTVDAEGMMQNKLGSLSKQVSPSQLSKNTVTSNIGGNQTTHNTFNNTLNNNVNSQMDINTVAKQLLDIITGQTRSAGY